VAYKLPNLQVAVYLLPVCVAPSPIFMSSNAFPMQALKTEKQEQKTLSQWADTGVPPICCF
jgi:hypothetical protein